MMFQDRAEAGRKLAETLTRYRGQPAMVLALPRGGVVVGYEIAQALHLPLDVIITHKIPAPGNPEYAIGAVAENGEAQLNEEEITALGIPPAYIERQIEAELKEIVRRRLEYRGGRSLPPLRDKIAIIADDGVATGYTMMAAIKAARAEQPRKVVVAVPVGPEDTIAELTRMADEVVALATPTPFYAVGAFYRNFRQTSDDEVVQLLQRARGSGNRGQGPGAGNQAPGDRG
jgi:putative phosphoribosyl transferase